jgi:hypothetical protein
MEVGSGNKQTTTAEDILFEISSQTIPHAYHTFLFFNGLAEGDEITFRVYVYDVDGAAYVCYYDRPANWATINLGKERAIRIPTVETTNYKVTLQKVAGNNSTVRYHWIKHVLP